MSTWIKAPDGQRFLLEAVLAYSANDAQISIWLRAGTMLVVCLPRPLAVEGQAYVAPALAYAELLDKELARLNQAAAQELDDVPNFARDVINWATERERLASDSAEAAIYRRCIGEILLQMSRRPARKAR